MGDKAAVELNVPLLLEAAGVKPVILQQATTDNGGVMRVRVPFYVGGSITRAAGISKKILFQESILPAIIQEGNRRIETKRPPLTVYARHAHAINADHLPIGGVTALEQEGRIGYGTLDILTDGVPLGAHAQALIQHELLDAVSLRAVEYQLTSGRVNGESMLVCEGLAMSGIDLAPDQPAQETYGMQILTQEAVIEPVQQQPVVITERRPKLDDPVVITLEAVRAQPNILEEIERPFRQQIADLTAERDKYKLENDVRGRDALILEIAGKTTNAEEFATTIKGVCEQKGVTTADGVHALVAPFLLQEVQRMRDATTTTPEETADQRLARLFKVGGAGDAGVVTPAATTAQPVITQEVIATHGTIDGGLLPEDD